MTDANRAREFVRDILQANGYSIANAPSLPESVKLVESAFASIRGTPTQGDEERAREIVACDGTCSVDHPHHSLARRISAALSAARAEERERCAKMAARTVCSIPPIPHMPGVRCGCDTANEIAAEIRALGAGKETDRG
jgi:hypothetical protein